MIYTIYIYIYIYIIGSEKESFYSFLSLAGGLLLSFGATGTLTWQPMALVFLSLIVCIVKTENQLKENFTDEGKSKKKH